MSYRIAIAKWLNSLENLVGGLPNCLPRAALLPSGFALGDAQVAWLNREKAPLAKGQRVGTLKVSLPSGAPVTEVPLLVQQGVEQAGFFGRAWDAIRLWIK